MDVTKLIGAVMAIGSVLLGGGLGAAALARANSAQLKAESASVAAAHQSGVDQVP